MHDLPHNGSQSGAPFAADNEQSSVHEHVEADTVNIEQGGAQTVNAHQVNVTQGGIQTVHAQQVEIQMGGAAQVQTSHFHLEHGGVASVQADNAIIEQARAGVIVTHQADVRNSRVFLLIADEINGQVQTLLDTRLAILLGASFGFVVGLLLLLFGHRDDGAGSAEGQPSR